ncbi:Glu/Leu/Phe/Val dehydrogenase dimerization domain-containing protein [Balneatrix alpica]|uniref:Glu/Leu/Phe/Val dehydrogenase dimerization domain-containing protein n=1 Tax=Balneatrix alpica TaxID=75684 RepID=A0ABV5ZEJ5_9GAMM|nr:Glu/Leu/Phe/Val dehydrogenase dimerization domain-containing protein [Balneatrix alpica]
MSVFSHSDFAGHEQVVFCHDRHSGLRAIIAIHNTKLGPALGGCRMYAYPSEADALTDVLRLSEGMSYKSALAGLPLGGGKSVIIGDPKTAKTPELLQAFGRALEQLGGRYITAEDSGTSVADMATIASQTRHVVGHMSEHGSHGDPSPSTAYGTFVGLRYAVQRHLQRDSLQGVKVAIQGLGNVGMRLARLLHEAGAELWVTDVDSTRLQQAHQTFGAKLVDLQQIHACPVDVFAPCALGGAINPHTLEQLQAKVIAGAANNQLAQAELGQTLHQRGILYAPDYVINAGGIIDVCYQHQGHYDAGKVRTHVEQIEHTLKHIFDLSEQQQRPTNLVADELAKAKVLG